MAGSFRSAESDGVAHIVASSSKRPQNSFDAWSGLTELSRITSQSKNNFGGRRKYGGEEQFYALKEVLGEGSFGSVYRCQRIADSLVCAAKIIDPRQLGFVGGEEGIKAVEAMAAREVDALRQLAAHPGVINLHDAFYSETTRKIFIVTEYVPGGHLFSHVIQRSEPFQEPEVAHIVAQLTDALSFCHEICVVHRDLKLENVLVSACDVKPWQCKVRGKIETITIELFSVKICDFGFAKALKGYVTATPIGTANYTAPEVDVSEDEPRTITETLRLANSINYDAFKADIFSLGVMVFVMLCHSYPVKDEGEGAHRLHKCWPDLSEDAKSFIDGLLAINPERRFDVIQANNHRWVRAALDDSTVNSKQISPEARSPHPRWGPQSGKNHELQGILSLQRAFVMMQQERAMACWALSNIGDFEGGDLEGISTWDDLRSRVQLTDKRICESKKLLQPCGSDPVNEIVVLISEMARARKLVFSNCPSAEKTDPGHENGTRSRELGAVCEELNRQVSPGDYDSTFDGVFLAYNHAIATMIDIVAKNLEQVRPGSNMVRRAARRYRLFSTAVEQLGRERTFILGEGIHPFRYSGTKRIDEFEPEKLRRLGEILGARKVLLGTSGACGTDMSGDIVADSSGLLGTLIGHREPPLLSAAEIASLESIEERVIACDVTVGGDEWYRTLTRLMTSIHSRIAIDLVNDMHGRDDDDEDDDEDDDADHAMNAYDNGSFKERVKRTNSTVFHSSWTFRDAGNFRGSSRKGSDTEDSIPPRTSLNGGHMCCCEAGLKKIFRGNARRASF